LTFKFEFDSQMKKVLLALFTPHNWQHITTVLTVCPFTLTWLACTTSRYLGFAIATKWHKGPSPFNPFLGNP